MSTARTIVDWATRENRPFADPGSQQSDHEFDVAVIAGGVLHLFGCKSDSVRRVDQGMIFKQAALRHRLQGRGGVNAIVTTYPPGPDHPVWTKAEAQHVRIFAPDSQEMAACLDRIFGSSRPR